MQGLFLFVISLFDQSVLAEECLIAQPFQSFSLEMQVVEDFNFFIRSILWMLRISKLWKGLLVFQRKLFSLYYRNNSFLLYYPHFIYLYLIVVP